MSREAKKKKLDKNTELENKRIDFKLLLKCRRIWVDMSYNTLYFCLSPHGAFKLYTVD